MAWKEDFKTASSPQYKRARRSCCRTSQKRVVTLRVSGENVFHVWFDPAFAQQFQIWKRPVRLPGRNQSFRIGRINPEGTTAQGNAKNPWKIAQPNQRRHYRIDIDLEQFGAKARFQVSRGRFGQQPAALDEAHLGATLRFIHVMGGNENGFATVAQIVKQVPNMLAVHRIEPRGWFIEKKQGWVVHERATKRE